MKLLILSIMSLLLIGCVTVPQGTAPSSSPLISRSGQEMQYKILGPSSSDAGHFSLFGFIPFSRANIDAAINDAVKKRGGDNLINISYNVDYVYYFIFGTNTSISIKGDVIKYGEVDSNSIAAMPEIITYDKLPGSHGLSANVFSDGFGMSYGYFFPFSKAVFGKLGLGFRSYEVEFEEIYYGWNDSYTYTGSNEYQFIPLTFSVGVNTEGLIKTNIPVNGFTSLGVGYYPDISQEGWLNFGWNIGVGADYKIIPNLALGLFYNYNDIVLAEEVWYNDEDISYSEFGLYLRFTP